MLASAITLNGLWLGIVNGCGIALIAMGLVLVYRCSRVINFSAGAIGLPAASLFGNVTAWYALVALAALGLASLALLVALNLALPIAWLARRLLHLHPA